MKTVCVSRIRTKRSDHQPVDWKKQDNVRDVALNKKKCEQAGNIAWENLNPTFSCATLFSNSSKRLSTI